LLGETGSADFSGEAWCSWIKRGRRVLIELSTATDAWGNQRGRVKFLKVCILQIVILSGKRD